MAYAVVFHKGLQLSVDKGGANLTIKGGRYDFIGDETLLELLTNIA
jgi:hypothetical protein